MNRIRKACLMFLVCSFLSVLVSGCDLSDPVSNLTPAVGDAIKLAQTTTQGDARDQILGNAVLKAKTVDDIQALARSAYKPDNRDQILLDGASLARSTQDFINLARTAVDLNIRDQILVRGALSCTSVDEVISLAKTSSRVNVRDQILMSRFDLANTVEDFQKLGRAAGSVHVRDHILKTGAQKLAVSVATLDPDGTILALKDPDAATTGNQELQKVSEAMQKAQKAYTDAVSRGDSQEKILELNKQLLAAKKAYEALGGI